jgi:hypothetical protein
MENRERVTEVAVAQWAELAADAPDFARRIREIFDAGTNKTLATLKQDGAPRISGTELEFGADGTISLGMMPGSMKMRDVLRDPRVALHSPTLEPPTNTDDWIGDAKLSGTLRRVDPPAENAFPDAGYFELDVTEAVLTYVSGELLVVESWHPGRGWKKMSRT